MTINMVGQRFGKLEVLAYSHNNKHYAPYWICRCDCGVVSPRHGYSMRIGKTKSCGCLMREVAKEQRTTHGYTRDCASAGKKVPQVFSAWVSMRMRCTKENHPNWLNYGGRGITVCQEWLNSFAAFLSDMGEPPSPKHSLDRINNNGNYEPGNCRWATRREQDYNKRSTLVVTIGGESKTCLEWAQQYGLTPALLHSRIRLGWEGNMLVSPLRPLISQCSRGHELTDENTYHKPNTNQRCCRQCRKEHNRSHARKHQQTLDAESGIELRSL